MSSDNKQKNATKKKLTAGQKIMIFGFTAVTIALIGVGVMIYFLLNKEDKTETTDLGGNLVVDDSNLGTIEEDLVTQLEDGLFETNMNTVWTFPDGKSASSDAYLANSTANKNPITFDIILNDNNEKIFTSTAIPVGKSIKSIKLDKDLEAGNYEAVCLYHLWKKDGTELSTLSVNITLVITK